MFLLRDAAGRQSAVYFVILLYRARMMWLSCITRMCGWGKHTYLS